MLNFAKIAELGVGGGLAVIIVYLLLKFVERVFVKKNTSLEEKLDKAIETIIEVKTSSTEFRLYADKFYQEDWKPLMARLGDQDKKLHVLEVEIATLKEKVDSLEYKAQIIRNKVIDE